MRAMLAQVRDQVLTARMSGEIARVQRNKLEFLKLVRGPDMAGTVHRMDTESQDTRYIAFTGHPKIK